MRFFWIITRLFDSLFRRPATKMYPAKPPAYKPRTRGHINIDVDSCIFCGFCQRKCPSRAITVTKEEKKWGIERMKCIQCNSCVEVCPKKCLAMENSYTTPAAKGVEDIYHARIPDNTANNPDSGKARQGT